MYGMTSTKYQDSAQKVGKRLLTFRKEQRLTQAEMAEKLAIPKSTYVAWERDESEAGARLFLALQREFGTPSVLWVLGSDLPSVDKTIDWIELGRIAAKVDRARKNLRVYLDVEDIVEIAGSIYDRNPDERDKALSEFRMYLKIQLKHLPREMPPRRFSEGGKPPRPQSSGQWHRDQPWVGVDPFEDD